MDPGITILTVCALLCLGTAFALRHVLRSGRQAEAQVVAALERNSAVLSDLRTTSEQPKIADASLLERIEELERRMEVVHSDALKYLQKASAAEQRMNQRMAAFDEEEGGMSEEQARALLAQENQQTNSGGGQLTLAEIEAMNL